MVGCMAEATTAEIVVNTEEMGDAQVKCEDLASSFLVLVLSSHFFAFQCSQHIDMKCNDLPRQARDMTRKEISQMGVPHSGSNVPRCGRC